MNGIGKQIFVVVEQATVVGSFVTLRDALEFRAKSASRAARIVADHGEFDRGRFRCGTTDAVRKPDSADRRQ
jgi:hypothetical protein